MTLEILQKEMNKARKEGQKQRVEVISGLIADVKKAAIDKGMRANITEELVNSVMLKAQKTYREMIETCPPERVGTLNEYTTQAAIVDEFAPVLMDDENEILHSIIKLCASAGLTNTKANKGAIMKVVSGALKGKADMKIVNKVVNNWLQ